MNKLLLFFLCFCVIAAPSAFAQRAFSKASSYKEIPFNLLRLSPEDYKGKSIAVVADVTALSVVIPPDLEGVCKPGKFLYMSVKRPGNEEKVLPMVLRKTDEAIKFAAMDEYPVKSKLYLKVRKTSSTLRKEKNNIPEYYIEVDFVEQYKGKETAGKEEPKETPGTDDAENGDDETPAPAPVAPRPVATVPEAAPVTSAPMVLKASTTDDDESPASSADSAGTRSAFGTPKKDSDTPSAEPVKRPKKPMVLQWN